MDKMVIEVDVHDAKKIGLCLNMIEWCIKTDYCDKEEEILNYVKKIRKTFDLAGLSVINKGE